MTAVPRSRPLLAAVVLGLLAVLALHASAHHPATGRTAVHSASATGYASAAPRHHARSGLGRHASLGGLRAPGREQEPQQRVPLLASARTVDRPAAVPVVWLAGYPPGPALVPKYVLPAPGGRAPPAPVA